MSPTFDIFFSGTVMVAPNSDPVHVAEALVRLVSATGVIFAVMLDGVRMEATTGSSAAKLVGDFYKAKLAGDRP